ncbi:TraY domain-containing protein [Salmonella enterica]|nr:TraY domain-containing protein [Salmonella enterica]
MRQKSSRSAAGNVVYARLDDETNRLLINAKNRSGRSKTIEMVMRLRDHLLRYPDFYNSEYCKGVTDKDNSSV